MTVDGRAARHTDPQLQAGCGIELWNWEESEDCFIAVFNDAAAMQASGRWTRYGPRARRRSANDHQGDIDHG